MSRSQKGGNSPNEHRKNGESSKKLLNRKTKRENNNSSLEFQNLQIYLPNEIRCSICLEYQKFSSNCLKCMECSSYFHRDCYNLFNIHNEKTDEIKNDNNNPICARCKEEKIKNGIKISCYFCKEHDGIIKKLDENKYIHHYCYVFFRENLNNPKTGICKLCKKRNIPTIDCAGDKCKERYHIKCALENGLIFSLPFWKDEKNEKKTFNDLILFLCRNHNKLTIESYAEYISAMNQSMNDKKVNESDNNPINDNQNNNNEDFISLNNDKDNNITNNIEESKEKEIENKSISSNSSGDNYGLDNDADDGSDKTPPNNFPLDKRNSNSINEKNSNSSNNNIANNSKNNYNDINNTTAANNNKEKDDKTNKIENLNNLKNINNNIEDDVEEQIDIKMDIEGDGKKENGSKVNLLEKSKIKDKINKDEEGVINLDNKQNENFEFKNEVKEKEEYKIPKIKEEKIDLFANFNKMNEDYCFPGCFFRLHGI